MKWALVPSWGHILMRFPDPFLQIHGGLRSTEACTLNFLEVPISVKKLRVGNVHWVTPQLTLFSTENGCVTKKCRFRPKQCPLLRLQGCQELLRGCYQSRVTRAVPVIGSRRAGVTGGWWPWPGRGQMGFLFHAAGSQILTKNVASQFQIFGWTVESYLQFS